MQIFSNADIVTHDDRFRGYVVVENGLISEVGAGSAPEKGHDLGGDYLLPGLIEIHTDHLEAHVMPRPKVEWNPASAVLAYDAQIAASGITTVFDSLRIGIDEHEIKAGVSARVAEFAGLIAEAAAAGHLRCDHLTHIRCEVPARDVVDELARFLERFPVQLISLMDHTPGQRQFRDLGKYFTYYGGKTGKSDADVREVVERRQNTGAARAGQNRPLIVAMAAEHGIRLASHDDTTLDEVALSQRDGVSVAEFPTTLEAAQASQAAGMATVMGAPNVVRGGSHSGNVAARELADANCLDMLSSDYVPASLLLGAFQLADSPGIGGLPGAIRLVTANPARALGLDDRGMIAVGKRADLIRVTGSAAAPVVRTVWRAGERVA
ncbi:MAG: alpha-D-ribose 1-methylphosphonate 5-triphosphate diphosphatase [Beijerinckiaceae bacterium]|nr:alpha-D-ribose 1-methylphosphonate 5-triphosphate diphosphatase [Beijerinckiaceae bacterium]